MSAYPASGEPPLDLPYPGAPFGAAYRRFWKKGFTFAGRASASEYWKAYLLSIGVSAAIYVLALIVGVIAGLVSSLTWLVWFSALLLVVAALYALATIVPAIAAAVRRLHDTNQPGVMYLLSFIPAVGGIILIVMLAQSSNPAGARFDPPTAQGRRAVPPLPPAAVPVVPASFPPAPVGYAPTPPTIASPVPPPPASVERTFIPRAAPSAPPAGPISSVPGAPPVRTVAAPPSPLPLAPAAVAEADVDDTRLPASAARWTVTLGDGRSVPLTGAVYLGRQPIAADGQPAAVLVPIDDPARSVSKTHARISPAADTVEVTDLHSTNGTRVRMNGQPEVPLSPGVAFPLAADATVSLGDYELIVRRTG